MDTLDLLEQMGRVEAIDPQLLEDTVAQVAALETTPVVPTLLHVVPVRRRRTVVHRALGVAAAVVLVVAGVVLLQSSPASSPRHLPPTELGRLALAADDQPAQSAPGPGQFMYTSSDEAYTSSTYDGPGKDYTVLVPEQRQIWIGADGSGRLAETFGTPVFLSAQDHADWVADGSPTLSFPPSDTTFGPGGLSDGPTDLSTLPTDPKTLAAMISARHIEGGPPGPGEDFTQVGDLLRETDAPPALRAALFDVAEGIPGVQQLGTVTDHSGRPGVGIALTAHGVRHELIFNADDSSLMGEQDVTVGLGSDEPIGTLDDWVVYLQSAVVDSDGASPNSTPVTNPAPTGNSPQPATGTTSTGASAAQ